MQRVLISVLATAAFLSVVSVSPAYPQGMGGGLIEALFNGGEARPAPRGYRGGPQALEPFYREPAPRYQVDPFERRQYPRYVRGEPAEGEPSRRRAGVPAKFRRQVVDYDGAHAPGTIVVDTTNRFLYLVEPGNKAIRYGIGVGREGFGWKGTQTVSAKKEWPDWRPPAEMRKRRPDLPEFMAGGPDNPLGARALYLGSTLYRIHGSNEPWTIGQAVSSGCFRMVNDDVIDLYDRVKVGARVVVM